MKLVFLTCIFAVSASRNRDIIDKALNGDGAWLVEYYEHRQPRPVIDELVFSGSHWSLSDYMFGSNCKLDRLVSSAAAALSVVEPKVKNSEKEGASIEAADISLAAFTVIGGLLYRDLDQNFAQNPFDQGERIFRESLAINLFQKAFEKARPVSPVVPPVSGNIPMLVLDVPDYKKFCANKLFEIWPEQQRMSFHLITEALSMNGDSLLLQRFRLGSHNLLEDAALSADFLSAVDDWVACATTDLTEIVNSFINRFHGSIIKPLEVDIVTRPVTVFRPPLEPLEYDWPTKTTTEIV